MRLLKKLYLIVKRLAVFYVDGNIGSASAQLSYYMLFTFFPVLLFGSTVLSRLVPYGEVLKTDLIPAPIMEFARDYIGEISERGSARVMMLSLFLTLYSLTRYVKHYRGAIARLYGGRRSMGFFLDYSVSFLFSLFLLILFFLSTVSVFFADRLLSAIGILGIAGRLWDILRFLAVSVYAFFVISAIYYIECGKDKGFKYYLKGSFFTVVVWGIISYGFSVYAEKIADYSVVYGSLGRVIMLLVWLNITNTVLLTLGSLNRILP